MAKEIYKGVDVSDVDVNIPYRQVNADVVESMERTPRIYWLFLGVPLTLIAAGALVFYYQTIVGLQIWGTGESAYWGIDIPTFIFFIGLSHSGTLLSAILLLTKSDWRKPIYRSAEAMTFFALITAAIALSMHVGRTWRIFYMLPYPNWRFLWTSFRSALSWDFVAITSYMTLSGLFLVMGSIPDFAAARDKMSNGIRKKLFTIISFGWKGTEREWRNLHRAYIVLAAFLVPLAASVHSVVAWDWAVTNVPGFHSTIFAPFFVTGAIYSGVAGVIIVMIIIRKALHMEQYIKPFHIDMLSKLLLVVGLVWIYITAMEVLTPWYKTSVNNFEFLTLLSKLKGAWAQYYWAMVLFCGVIPLLMFSRKIRTNLVSMLFISIGIEIGMFLERFIIIVPGQSSAYIPSRWGTYVVSWVEIFLFLIFTSSIFFLLFLVFVKFVPPVSIYEVKELLKIPRRKRDRESEEKTQSLKEPVAPNTGGNT